MKILFIGGTGTISRAVSEKVLEEGHELYLLNRGSRNNVLPDGAVIIKADINNVDEVSEKIKGMSFDCVADFIAFKPEDVERDYNLFKDKTSQYIFVSSASAYQKPVGNYLITEGTPLCNPYWEYSRNKIACEDLLLKLYREKNFPVMIVRPSYTYDERSIPLAVHGRNGSYQIIKRMLEGKKVIVQGDGTSLWVMTYNKDFAKGFTGLIGNIRATGESFHITSDEVLTWNQIYSALANALGVEYKPYYVSSDFLSKCGSYDFTGSLTGDKSASVVFDNSKIKKLVPSFCSTVRFDQGMRLAVDYIMKHEECRKEDTEFDKWCDNVIAVLDESAAKIKAM